MSLTSTITRPSAHRAKSRKGAAAREGGDEHGVGHLIDDDGLLGALSMEPGERHGALAHGAVGGYLLVDLGYGVRLGHQLPVRRRSAGAIAHREQ